MADDEAQLVADDEVQLVDDDEVQLVVVGNEAQAGSHLTQSQKTRLSKHTKATKRRSPQGMTPFCCLTGRYLNRNLRSPRRNDNPNTTTAIVRQKN